jgi:hypothetical protein
MHFVQVPTDLFHRSFEPGKQCWEAINVDEVFQAECMHLFCGAIFVGPP